MARRNITQTILFVIFFSVGAASLGSAVLCEDLVQYYQNKRSLKAAQESVARLESLNTDYDVLLHLQAEDPNFVRRLAPVTPGSETEDANTVYPRATPEELAAARRALMTAPEQQVPEPVLPGWLSRCSEPRSRLILFISGIVLILTSLICFQPKKRISETEID
jgi:hypothetical protein